MIQYDEIIWIIDLKLRILQEFKFMKVVTETFSFLSWKLNFFKSTLIGVIVTEKYHMEKCNAENCFIKTK